MVWGRGSIGRDRCDKSPPRATGNTPPGPKDATTETRWQVSWLAGHRLGRSGLPGFPKGFGFPVATVWTLARRTQLRGQPRHAIDLAKPDQAGKIAPVFPFHPPRSRGGIHRGRGCTGLWRESQRFLAVAMGLVMAEEVAAARRVLTWGPHSLSWVFFAVIGSI